MSLGPAKIEAAFLAACRAEIETLKPGNVHRFAPGHGMTAETFLRAAAVAAPEIARGGTPVGMRILAATRASFEAVGMNANLGIVLLCAPLAAAAETLKTPLIHQSAASMLRKAVAAVLADLDADDAADAFAAIALAGPGGLGARTEHDVRDAPTIGLVEAMALAPEADLVARQYGNGFSEIFEVGLPAADSAAYPDECSLGDAATFTAFIAFASRFPDGHIARKFGVAVAEDVRRRFAALSDALAATDDDTERLALARAFDAELKAEGLNPGTSADLTVATLMAKKLAEALAE
ncbi:triphosphoribosyl-dephospho-CoA synthase [Jiella endophytica]|uniref:Triphosphoribosyl-dephospho-CoA synthase n=1 Tax=Jiella endophytica TaxID=2558362 RepID=A0A4Y8RVD7_9HYPH|nr:triphosphoribosyl-dephospho-CoA synthase [Jiella endophytica]TFF27787.1 triphosphoribosyl-dephospho-CoA synthase [Jiella endophytica]